MTVSFSIIFEDRLWVEKLFLQIDTSRQLRPQVSSCTSISYGIFCKVLWNSPNLCLLRFFLLFLLAISPLKVTAELLCRLADPGAPMPGRRLSLPSMLEVHEVQALRRPWLYHDLLCFFLWGSSTHIQRDGRVGWKMAYWGCGRAELGLPPFFPTLQVFLPIERKGLHFQIKPWTLKSATSPMWRTQHQVSNT